MGLDSDRMYERVLAKPLGRPPESGRRAGSRPLGKSHTERELVSGGQLQEALSLQRKEGGVLGDILVRLGYLAREEILLALAAQMGMEVVDLADMKIPPGVTNKVPPLMARSYKVVPIKWENSVLTVA